MRYFFLAYAIVAVLVVGIFGFRGDKFLRSPIRIFPDMREQDKLKAQQPDRFFSNGQGARLPVTGTQPRGFAQDGANALGGIPEYEFGGGTGYYFTGHIGDYFGNGMPEELKLTADNSGELLRRGKERFEISCSPCHGKSGNGQGFTSRFGVPVTANPYANLAGLTQDVYPDGRLFETITKGKGNMSGYAPNISVRDRWAVIAYIHALQTARKAPLEDPAVKSAFDKNSTQSASSK